MFCKNCGKELEPGDIFCQTCGARVNEAINVVPDNETIEPGNITKETKAQNSLAGDNRDAVVQDDFGKEIKSQNSLGEEVTETITQTEFNDEIKTQIIPETEEIREIAKEQDVNSVDSTTDKPKKRFGFFKKMKKSVIVTILVILLAVTAFASPGIRNSLLKAVLSPKHYFQYVLVNNIGGGSDDIGKFIDELKNSSNQDQSAEGELKIEIGDGMPEVIDEVSGVIPYYGYFVNRFYTQYIDWFDNASVEYASSVKDEKTSVDLGLKINEQEIVDASVLVDRDGQMLYAGLPGLHEQYIGGTLPVEMIENMEEMDKIIELIPDKKIVKSLIKRYAVCLVEQLEDIEESEDTVEVEGVSQKTTLLTVSVNEETLKNVGLAVLEEAKDDEELKEIIENFENSEINTESEDIYNQFLDAIDDAQKELEDTEVSDDEIFEIRIWVNGKGEIVGFGLGTSETEDIEIEYISLEKGKKFGECLKFESGMSKFSIEGGGTVKGNKRNGELFVKFNRFELLKITLDNVDVNSLENGYINGTIIIEPDEALFSILERSDVGFVSDFKIVYEAQSKSDKDTNEKIGLLYDDELCLSISVVNKIGKGKSVKLPVDYVDAEDDDALQNWAEELEYDKIIENIEEAGLPSSLVDALESAGY